MQFKKVKAKIAGTIPALCRSNAFFCAGSTTPFPVAYKLNDPNHLVHLCPIELMSFPTSKLGIKATSDKIGKAIMFVDTTYLGV
jgi:hypothetical protein